VPRGVGRTLDGGLGLRGAIVVAAFLALVSATCFALAGAVLITLSNPEALAPGRPPATRSPVTGETLR
jgi:hypothetical protein